MICVATQKDIPGKVNVGHLKKDQPTLKMCIRDRAQLYIAPVVIRADGVLLLDAAAQRSGILS